MLTFDHMFISCSSFFRDVWHLGLYFAKLARITSDFGSSIQKLWSKAVDFTSFAWDHQWDWHRMVSYFVLRDVGLHAPCWRCWDDRCLAEWSWIHEIVKSWVSNTFPNLWILRWWPTSPTHWSMTFTCQTGKLGAWTFGRRGFPTVSSLFSVFLLLEVGFFFTVLLVWQILQSCVSPECLRMHFHSLALLWGIMWQASWQIWKVDDYPSSWGTWE